MSAAAQPLLATLLDAPPDSARARFGRRAVFLPLAIVTALLAGMGVARADLRRRDRRRAHQGGARAQDRATPRRRHRARDQRAQRPAVHAGDVLMVVDDVRSDAELSAARGSVPRRACAQRAGVRRNHAGARIRHRRQLSPPSRASPNTWRASARSSPRAAARSTSKSTRCNRSWARRTRSRGARVSQIESVENPGVLPPRNSQLNEKLVTRRLRAARAAAAAAAGRRRLPQPAGRIARRTGAVAPASRRARRAHGRRAQSISAGGHR